MDFAHLLKLRSLPTLILGCGRSSFFFCQPATPVAGSRTTNKDPLQHIAMVGFRTAAPTTDHHTHQISKEAKTDILFALIAALVKQQIEYAGDRNEGNSTCVLNVQALGAYIEQAQPGNADVG